MKRIIALALAVGMMLGLCSCGQSYDKLLKKNDPVTITIWHYYNGVQQTMLDRMISEFNETLGMEKGIIVEAFSQNTISELSDKVVAAAHEKVGAEELPDIFASYSETAYIADKAGKLADISRYFTKQELEAYIPGYLQEGQFSGDGTLKIFPVAKSTEVMILNETDWNKFAAATGASVDSLSTWEGLVQVAQQYYQYTDSLTPEVEGDGKAFFGRDSVANYMNIGAKQLGHPFVEVPQGGQPQAAVDRDTVKRLWENYYVPYVKGYFTANSRFRSDDAKTGAIIALICSTTGAAYQPYEVTIGDDISYPIENLVLPVPDFAGTDPYIVQQGAGMCVTKSEERVEYACAVFLKWFTQAERNMEFSVNSGYLPVTKEANNVEKLIPVAQEQSVKQIMQDTLQVAVGEINRCTLYTAPPFDQTITIRDFLSTYIQKTADEDRTIARGRIEAGEPRDAVLQSYTDDAAFDRWYAGFEAGFQQAAGK